MAEHTIVAETRDKMRKGVEFLNESLRGLRSGSVTPALVDGVKVDAYGSPIGDQPRDVARLATHAWEPLEISATAPAGAQKLQVSLISGVSGTAWFDGVSIEQR